MIYGITDWRGLYENSETRRRKNLGWVLTPNRHDSIAFGRLMARGSDGLKIFGAWMILLQLSSRGPYKYRGILCDSDGKPYTVVGFGNGAGSVLVEQEDGSYSGERPELTQEEAQDPDYLQQALIPASSESHSGVDVGLWAKGPWAHLFGGTMDQEMIFHVMHHATLDAAAE